MVLIVVRASGKKQQFVRTMYIMAEEKIEKYKKFGYFKKIQFDNDKNVCYNLVIHKILKESSEDGTGSRSPS